MASDPAATIRSYVTALTRRDLPAVLACFTPALRRQMSPAHTGFGALRDIISMRLRTIQERPPVSPVPPRHARGERLFLVIYVGHWAHPLVLDNGPHAVFIWTAQDAATAPRRIAADGTAPEAGGRFHTRERTQQ